MKRNIPIYMNALEFLSSWEKKWNELNKLDYFIYQSINLLIEKINGKLNIETQNNIEAVRSLSFLIGDKLENFLSNLCFSKCPLNCPLSPDKLVNFQMYAGKNKHLKKLSKDFSLIKKSHYQSHLWEKEINRYVVRETVVDFFRYNDNEFVLLSQKNIRKIINLATEILKEFSYSQIGRELLNNRDNKADEEFADALKREDYEKFGQIDSQDDNQMDFLLNDAIDEAENIEDLEDWQIPAFKMRETIDSYLLDFNFWKAFPGNALLKEKKDHLLLFSNFLEDFSFITTINEVDVALIHEFFYFYLPLYFELDAYTEIQQIHQTLLHFYQWMDEKKNIVNNLVNKSLQRLTPYINRLVQIRKVFYSKEVLEIFEGQDTITTYQNFYQVISRNESSLKLKTANLPFYLEVEIPPKTGLLFRKDDILDLVIAKNNLKNFSIWHLAHVYPGKAQIFIMGSNEDDFDDNNYD